MTFYLISYEGPGGKGLMNSVVPGQVALLHQDRGLPVCPNQSLVTMVRKGVSVFYCAPGRFRISWISVPANRNVSGNELHPRGPTRERVDEERRSWASRFIASRPWIARLSESEPRYHGEEGGFLLIMCPRQVLDLFDFCSCKQKCLRKRALSDMGEEFPPAVRAKKEDQVKRKCEAVRREYRGKFFAFLHLHPPPPYILLQLFLPPLFH
ncbi:hypothetical protein CDAR_509761 [Caerostris darwini]|uniref:Uncharacterized protein n=1 Tax=Caerostris darwini TaxID=1538125 RepID=A0AAV4N4J7_9ARAC|nr:hypothetical protein CDAR_509761 [Caerostris darwini]